MHTFFTKSKEETFAIAAKVVDNLEKHYAQISRGKAIIICLEGDLGAGKTTFAQGILQSLGATGPYTSPTFLIMKEYEIKSKFSTVYHIDAYRIDSIGMLDLGWDEIVANKKNIIIIEWPEKIETILPPQAMRIKFEYIKENERKISLAPDFRTNCLIGK